MTIHRIPVPGATLPPRLHCRVEECQPHFEDTPAKPNDPRSSVRHHCPYLNGAVNGCKEGAWLYPRKWKADAAGHRAYHFHQGIDLGAGGRPVVSVVAGEVVALRNDPLDEGFGDYGKTIVIHRNGFYYLYAHLSRDPDGIESDIVRRFRSGQRVTIAEGQRIGKVGNTDWPRADKVRDRPEYRGISDELVSENEIRRHTAMGAHLHFQINTAAQNTTAGDRERSLYEPASPSDTCVDPYEHLELLGPWGSGVELVANGRGLALDRRIFTLRGDALDRRRVDSESDDLVRRGLDEVGGLFPISVQKLWHGGVHVRFGPEGRDLRMPIAGKIVAMRLDEDETRTEGPAGRANFVLIRHELAEPIVAAFVAKRPRTADSSTEAPPAGAETQTITNRVGRRFRVDGPYNPPAMVQRIKARLNALNDPVHGHPYYAPSDPAELASPAVTDALHLAIVRFQLWFFAGDRRARAFANGVVHEGGPTMFGLETGGTLADYRAARAQAAREAAEAAAPAQTSQPSAPPPKVIYTLLMHLGGVPFDEFRVPWFSRLRHAPRDSSEEQEDRDEARREEEDASRRGRRGRRLHDSVGWAGQPLPERPAARRSAERRRASWNHPEDVQWVRRRLAAHGYPTQPEGEPVRTDADEELGRTIERFQRESRLRTTDAIVSPRGQTVDALAGRPVQARLVRLLRETTSDGTTAVVTGFVEGTDEILAGEVVWRSGSGFVHWEMFSDSKLMGDEPDSSDRWASAEDSTDDLNVDAPSVLTALAAFTEQNSPAVSLDDEAEIRAFYEADLGRTLRKWQVRFKSEWSQDPSQYRAALEGENVLNASGLAVDRYIWWSAAGGAVPSDSIVWHYHPLQFLLALGHQTDAFVGTVVVSAYNEEGIEPAGRVAIVAVDGSYDTLVGVLASGQVTFPRVLPGRARVEIDLGRSNVEQQAQEVDVLPGVAVQVVFANVRNPNALMWVAP